MKYLLLIFIVLLNGCSLISNEKQKVSIIKVANYTYRIPKIKPVKIKINESGGLDNYNKNKAFNLIKKLRKSEDYYYTHSKEKIKHDK